MSNDLDNSLIRLFQFFSRDLLIVGTRSLMESLTADTKGQARESGITRIINPELPLSFGYIEDRINKLMGEGKERREARGQAFEELKKNYSWLSSIRMEHEKKDRKNLLKPRVNEDEHALPFYFMLIFGGGLSRVPWWSAKGSHQKEYLDIMEIWKGAKDEGRPLAPEEEQKWKRLTEYVKGIGEAGTDTTLAIKVPAEATAILNYMEMPEENRQLFFKNSHILNYFGMFLSEAFLNQCKSNLIFIKLCLDRRTLGKTAEERIGESRQASFKATTDENVEVSPTGFFFQPSDTMIDAFVKQTSSAILRHHASGTTHAAMDIEPRHHHSANRDVNCFYNIAKPINAKYHPPMKNWEAHHMPGEGGGAGGGAGADTQSTWKRIQRNPGHYDNMTLAAFIYSAVSGGFALAPPYYWKCSVCGTTNASPREPPLHPVGTPCPRAATHGSGDGDGDVAMGAGGAPARGPVASENMKTILRYLCHHYTKFLYDRIFFNCIMLKVRLRLEGKASGPRAARGAAAVTARAAAARAAEGSQSQFNLQPGTAEKQRPLNGNSDDDRSYIDEYIKEYIKAMGTGRILVGAGAGAGAGSSRQDLVATIINGFVDEITAASSGGDGGGGGGGGGGAGGLAHDSTPPKKRGGKKKRTSKNRKAKRRGSRVRRRKKRRKRRTRRKKRRKRRTKRRRKR